MRFKWVVWVLVFALVVSLAGAGVKQGDAGFVGFNKLQKGGGLSIGLKKANLFSGVEGECFELSFETVCFKTSVPADFYYKELSDGSVKFGWKVEDPGVFKNFIITSNVDLGSVGFIDWSDFDEAGLDYEILGNSVVVSNPGRSGWEFDPLINVSAVGTSVSEYFRKDSSTLFASGVKYYSDDNYSVMMWYSVDNGSSWSEVEMYWNESFNVTGVSGALYGRRTPLIEPIPGTNYLLTVFWVNNASWGTLDEGEARSALFDMNSFSKVSGSDALIDDEYCVGTASTQYENPLSLDCVGDYCVLLRQEKAHCSYSNNEAVRFYTYNVSAGTWTTQDKFGTWTAHNNDYRNPGGTFISRSYPDEAFSIAVYKNASNLYALHYFTTADYGQSWTQSGYNLDDCMSGNSADSVAIADCDYHENSETVFCELYRFDNPTYRYGLVKYDFATDTLSCDNYANYAGTSYSQFVFLNLLIQDNSMYWIIQNQFQTPSDFNISEVSVDFDDCTVNQSSSDSGYPWCDGFKDASITSENNVTVYALANGSLDGVFSAGANNQPYFQTGTFNVTNISFAMKCEGDIDDASNDCGVGTDGGYGNNEVVIYNTTHVRIGEASSTYVAVDMVGWHNWTLANFDTINESFDLYIDGSLVYENVSFYTVPYAGGGKANLAFETFGDDILSLDNISWVNVTSFNFNYQYGTQELKYVEFTLDSNGVIQETPISTQLTNNQTFFAYTHSSLNDAWYLRQGLPDSVNDFRPNMNRNETSISEYASYGSRLIGEENYQMISDFIGGDFNPDSGDEGDGYNLSRQTSFTVLETDVTDLNASFVWNASVSNVSQVVLWWNGSEYSPSSTGSDSSSANFTYALTLPRVGDSAVPVQVIWQYNVTWANGTNSTVNASTQTQTVYPMVLSASSGTEALNFLFMDEDTGGVLSNVSFNANFYVWYEDVSAGRYYNLSFGGNASNYSVFKSPAGYDFRVNAELVYNASGYDTRYHYLSNVSVDDVLDYYYLYLGNASDTTSFLATYQDSYYLYVPSVVIDVWRKFPNGSFVSVEQGLTDDNGQTVVHLVPETVIYKFLVWQNGTLVYTSGEYRALCQAVPCQINLREASNVSLDYGVYENMIYSFDTNVPNREANFSFSTKDGSSVNMSMEVLRRDNATVVYNSSLVGSGGLLSASVPLYVGNDTYDVYVWRDGEYFGGASLELRLSSYDIFGYTGLLLTGFGFLMLALMGIASGAGVIVLGILSLAFMSLMMIFEAGSVFGIGSSIVWLIVGGGILLWKISQRRVS